jgi:hypothetical protein
LHSDSLFLSNEEEKYDVELVEVECIAVPVRSFLPTLGASVTHGSPPQQQLQYPSLTEDNLISV